MINTISTIPAYALTHTPLTTKSSSLSPRSILRDGSGARTFFLTFDAHDDNTNISFILDTLKKNGCKATFFLTGTFIQMFPEETKRIAAEGHTVGNHTFTHTYYRSNGVRLRQELRRTEDLFYKTTGQHMSKLWRAPFLQHQQNKRLLQAAASLGYTHIDVTLYTMDWIDKNTPGYISNDEFLDIFTRSLRCSSGPQIRLSAFNIHSFRKNSRPDLSGTILLMHGKAYRKKAKDFIFILDSVITHLRNSGYTFQNCGVFLNPSIKVIR